MLVRIGGLRSAKNFPKFFGRKAAERTSSNAFAVTGALSHACLVTDAKKALNLSVIRVCRPGLGQTGDWQRQACGNADRTQGQLENGNGVVGKFEHSASIIGGRKTVSMGVTIVSLIDCAARTINVSTEPGTTFFPKRPSQSHSASDD
jgi:hypothetical protein